METKYEEVDSSNEQKNLNIVYWSTCDEMKNGITRIWTAFFIDELPGIFLNALFNLCISAVNEWVFTSSIL